MKRWKVQIDNLAVAVVMFIVCITLTCVMFMQFRTVEETDITSIENMREAELRTTLAEWKSKYEETYQKLVDTNKKIEEYNEKIEKNEEVSGLIDKELEQSELMIGKTDVYGEGVIVTLRDNQECDISSLDLIRLINELRYAGAEAISINDIRITNNTYITDIDEYSYINIGGQRVASPYVVKAIGNPTYLSSILNLKDSGYIDKSKSEGKDVSIENKKKIEILKYNGEMTIKYVKNEEE